MPESALTVSVTLRRNVRPCGEDLADLTIAGDRIANVALADPTADGGGRLLAG